MVMLTLQPSLTEILLHVLPHWSLLRSDTSCVTNWLKGIVCSHQYEKCGAYRTTHRAQKRAWRCNRPATRCRFTSKKLMGFLTCSLVAVAGSQIYRDARAGPALCNRPKQRAAAPPAAQPFSLRNSLHSKVSAWRELSGKIIPV